MQRYWMKNALENQKCRKKNSFEIILKNSKRKRILFETDDRNKVVSKIFNESLEYEKRQNIQ